MFAACCFVLFCLSLLLPVNSLTFQRLHSHYKRGTHKKSKKSAEELIVFVKNWVHYACRNYMIGVLCKIMSVLTSVFRLCIYREMNCNPGQNIFLPKSSRPCHVNAASNKRGLSGENSSLCGLVTKLEMSYTVGYKSVLYLCSMPLFVRFCLHLLE